MPAEILQHEPSDARAGVERREDEQRLEHDGEVIPERHRACRRRARCEKMLRHADGEARRAAGARQQRCLADLLRERVHLGRVEREAPVRAPLPPRSPRWRRARAAGALIAK